eukprot:SAG31_NODE_3220_length_4530_cov_2.256601_2_plen_340_part_00
MRFSADVPATDRRCSASERLLIHDSIRCEADRTRSSAMHSNSNVMLTRLELAAAVMSSGAVWSIILVGVASSFTIFVLEDGLPSYMRDVGGLSLTEVGFLASLPALVKGVLTVFTAWAADRLRSRGRIAGGLANCTTARVRKSFQAISIGPQGIILAALALGTQTSPNMALALLVMTDCLSGFKYGGGASVNHLDIAPHLAGIIQGVKNGIGQAVAFVVPILIGYLTPYPGGLSREQLSVRSSDPANVLGKGGSNFSHMNGSSVGIQTPFATVDPPEGWVLEMQDQWRRVFMIAAVMDALGMVIYLIFGKGERQWWDVAAATRSKKFANGESRPQIASP